MLLKNVIKTFGKKWLQLIAIGIIICSSALIFSMMTYGLSGVDIPTQQYLVDYNQEDFAVEMMTTPTVEEASDITVGTLVASGIYELSDIKQKDPAVFKKIIAKRLDAFADVYPDVEVELRAFKLLDFDHQETRHKAFIAKDMQHINKSFIEEGTKPVQKNEIAINKIYARKHELKIGDTFPLNDDSYVITGFVLFPDYTLPSFGDNPFMVDTTMLPLILMTDQAYEQLDVKEYFRFAGVDPAGKEIDTTFSKEKLPFVTQIIPTATNMRSGAVYDELSQSRITALGLSLFIALIAVIIVAIMVSNILHFERGQIGILKAMGYRKKEIALPYLLAVSLFSIVMLFIGYFLGFYFAEPLKNVYLDFYLLPETLIHQDLSVFLTAIFIPLLFIVLFSGIIIYRILAEKPLDLLRPRMSSTLNRFSRFISLLLSRAKVKASTKFKYLYAIRSTGSFIILFVGILFSTLLTLFGFMMDGMFEEMTVGYLDKVAYNYQAFADFTKPLPNLQEEEEKFLYYPYANLNDAAVKLEGLDPASTLFKLYDHDQTDLTAEIEDGIVITKSIGLKQDLAVGDTIDLEILDQTVSLEINGITEEYTDMIYMDIAELSAILSVGASRDLYSGIYSIDRPAAEFYNVILPKQDLYDQAKAMKAYTDMVIKVMISGAIVIGTSILFVLTAFTVEKNYYPISLLKVLGYRRKEINAMVLNSYFTYALASFIISIPAANLILDLLMNIFLKEYGIIIPLAFTLLDGVKAFGLFIFIFIISTYINRRKIHRIPLQEILKTYGE